MASLPFWNQKPASHSIFFIGLAVFLSGSLSFCIAHPAQACDGSQVQKAAQTNYQSPVDLSEITPTEQRALEALVAERQKRLPYRSLSISRCPSLSNAALMAFEKHNYADALALLDKAIADQPGLVSRWLDRAVIHYYIGEDEAARADAKQFRQLTAAYSHKINEAYSQLMLQLEGELPDPRRAVEL